MVTVKPDTVVAWHRTGSRLYGAPKVGHALACPDVNVVVEAGGVEPPSEKVRNEENYVRIRIMIFDFHL